MISAYLVMMLWFCLAVNCQEENWRKSVIDHLSGDEIPEDESETEEDTSKFDYRLLIFIALYKEQ